MRAKRMICILLTLVMLLGMLPMSALAAGNVPFTDVKVTDWFYDAVEYVYDEGLMSGTSATTFAPNGTTTRGMIVTILHRLEGLPVVYGETFTDVAEGAYYADAVAWASGMGVVTGYGDGRFGPNDAITRQQLATILFRYAGFYGKNTVPRALLDDFKDADSVTDYAIDAMQWAVAEDLIKGSDGYLNPNGFATRAQVATILERFCNAGGGVALLPGFIFDRDDDTTYTVTFDSNGGSAVTPQEVKKGECATEPDMPFNPGYRFDGWYTDGETYETEYDFSTPVEADLTLYAKWEDGGSFNVTYMLNNGTDGAYAMKVVPYGATVERPADPTMVLHSFDGWYSEPEAMNEFDFSTPITEDKFLYAKWTAPDGDDSVLYDGTTGGGTTYSITGVDMSGQELVATINANESAILVARFYEDTEELFSGDFATDPNAPALLGATSVRTPDYCEMVPVSMLVTDTLPEYYYITVDLYDDEGNQLCETRVSLEKTARYEIFEGKTVEDFEKDLVVQFTDEMDKNFGVLAEHVKRIRSDETTNTLEVNAVPYVMTLMEEEQEEEETVEPVDDRLYTFTNPDAELLALQVGDTVYIEGTSYLFKIDTITEEDGMLIMTEADDVEITDFYQYIKVDMDIENPQEEQPQTYARSAVGYSWEVLDANPSFQIGGEIHWKPQDWLELSGGLSVTGHIHLKVEYDLKVFEKDYLGIEVSVEAEFKVTANVAASIDNKDSVSSKTEKDEYVLIKVGVPTPVAGLTIEIKPSVPMELEAKASFNFEYNNKVKSGFVYSSYNGKQNIDEKESSVKLYFEGEASAKIGPKLKISVAFCKSVLEAGVNAAAGVKFTAKTNEIGGEITDADSKHGCTLCVEGTVKWFVEVYADVTYCIIKEILEGEIGKWYIVKLEGNFPISPNFYVSIVNSQDSYLKGTPKFGWGTCPNTCYRTDFIVKDADGNELENIAIKVKHSQTGREKSGDSRYRVYLYKGAYTASATVEGTSITKSVSVSSAPQEIILTASSADGKAYGSVIDANTGAAISDASVVFSQDGVDIAATSSAADGSYQVNLADGTYLLVITKDGYRTFRDHVTIANAATSYLQPSKLVPGEDDDKRGGFSGRIVDSVTGNPISGVRIEVRSGWNHPDEGEILKVLHTNSDGEFRCEMRNLFGIYVGLKPGEYTLTASKDGYTTTSHNVVVESNTEKGGQGFSMSPELGDNQYRIVLSWGASPRDLDSHLIAPLPSGDTFHLYFPQAETNGSHSYTEYFTLDLDDTTSYGPETTTIKKTVDGKYYFYVYNWSGESSIASSGAKVDVYYGNSMMTFNVPLDQGNGRYWNVFVLDTERNIITPVNTITDSAVQTFSLAPVSDEHARNIAMIEADMANTPK